jgi:hypothetical protein
MSILKFVKTWPKAISRKNRDFILQLIYVNIQDFHEREIWLSELESASEDDADELIQSLLNKYV